jgi:hypothetical protein
MIHIVKQGAKQHIFGFWIGFWISPDGERYGNQQDMHRVFQDSFALEGKYDNQS